MKVLQLWSALGIAAVLLAPSATAAPEPGVDVETLSKNTVDGTDYLVTRITVAPGSGRGWHYHPGEVFGYIQEGTMTHYDGGCVVDAVYGPGAPVKEGVGSTYVHHGRNLGSTPLVMEVVYINPSGAPLSVTVPQPTDCPIP